MILQASPGARRALLKVMWSRNPWKGGRRACVCSCCNLGLVFVQVVCVCPGLVCACQTLADATTGTFTPTQLFLPAVRTCQPGAVLWGQQQLHTCPTGQGSGFPLAAQHPVPGCCDALLAWRLSCSLATTLCRQWWASSLGSSSTCGWAHWQLMSRRRWREAACPRHLQVGTLPCCCLLHRPAALGVFS